MTSPLAARRAVAKATHRHPFAPVMTFTDNGLVLGTTVLAPTGCDADGLREVAIDAVAERILALLATAYGKTVEPGVLGNIRRAAQYSGRDETNLAEIEIALSGLPPLSDKEAVARLAVGEKLLAAGLTPRELIKACRLGSSSLDFLRAGFNPDQPRVPAGNPDGGQWTYDSDETTPTGERSSAAGGASATDISRVDPNIEFVDYAPVHGLPNDSVMVRTPDDKTIADPDSGTKLLMAPPRANFRDVYAAGRAIASLPLPEQCSKGRAAVAQGGTYDFQRDVKQQKFYYAYIHAANYVSCSELRRRRIYVGGRIFAGCYARFRQALRVTKL